MIDPEEIVRKHPGVDPEWARAIVGLANGKVNQRFLSGGTAEIVKDSWVSRIMGWLRKWKG